MLQFVVLLLTVATGFTGLAYEIAWQRYLATLLGAHSQANAAVLGIFLGGLSLGYWLFGSLTRRVITASQGGGVAARLLVIYGGVEAAIGVYALVFPHIFRLVRQLSLALPVGAGVLPFALDVVLCVVLIGPPTVLMGATIPILTQALARSLEDSTRVHARIYSFNTVGAFVGALAAGFVLIPQLGLDGVMRAMAGVNIAAGVCFAALGTRSRSLVPLVSPSGEASTSGIPAVYAAAALFVGFAMMAMQVIILRIAALSLGSSEYTFSMVVAVFVLCIALGSLGISALSRVGRWLLPLCLWLLALCFALLATHMDSAPYWAHVLRSMYRDQPEAFLPFQIATFLSTLVVLGPAIVLSGTTLPLLFDAVRRELGDVGANAGRLYSVNTLGSLLGALLAGHLLLFWLDLEGVYRIGIAALAAAAALVTGRVYARVGAFGAAALVCVAVVGMELLPDWRPQLLSSGMFRMRQPGPGSYEGPRPIADVEYLFYEDGPNTSVAVTTDGSSRTLVVNGKSDGNTIGDRNTMALAAILPALFAQHVETAFVIGYGTGITVGELAALDEMQSVTVAEISPAVVNAAPLFDLANLDASKHPKVEIVQSDAFRALARGANRYDVIVSEPSNPWVSGVEMLFSREFLEAARARLTPGGIYAQWIHGYETNDASLELVARTFASVFDHVAVWNTLHADFLLLGFNDASTALDLPRLEERAARPDLRAALLRVGIRGLPELLVHEAIPFGVLHEMKLEGPLHTLYHPLLGFQAGRGFFSGAEAAFPFSGYGAPARVGRENSLLRRHLAPFGASIPPAIRNRIAIRACGAALRICPVLLADWAREGSDEPALRQQIARARELGVVDSPDVIDTLARYLGGGPAETSFLTPRAAVDATNLYITRYAPPRPFDPAALRAVWDRCRPDHGAPDSCKMGEVQVREIWSTDGR